MRAFLESLAANRLMLTDGRNWLSLAVRVREVPRANPPDCKCKRARGLKHWEAASHVTAPVFKT